MTKRFGYIDSQNLTVGGVTFLDNYKLLESTDFPNTTNLYGNHLVGTSDFDGSAWVGGEVLTEAGSIGAGTNHLGDTTYCDFNGSSSVYYNSSTFDTANESFTVGGWYQIDANTAYLIGKNDGVNANKSFQAYLDGNSQLSYLVFYNGSGGSEALNIDMPELLDGSYYHIVFVYDQSNTSMSVVVNGKVRGHHVSANLANRNNNAATKLTFCALDDSTLLSPLNGRLSDPFYQKSALTLEQIRELYVVGSQRVANKDQNNIVQILGEIANKGSSVLTFSNQNGLTNTSYTDISGWEFYIPYTGMYKIKYSFSCSVVDANDNDVAITDFRLYNKTTATLLRYGTFRLSGWTSTSSSAYHSAMLGNEVMIHATADDNISLQYAVAAGDTLNAQNGELIWEYLGQSI